jgi:hypothetical protein
MSKIIRLTEADLTRIVRRVINEQSQIVTSMGQTPNTKTNPGQLNATVSRAKPPVPKTNPSQINATVSMAKPPVPKTQSGSQSVNGSEMEKAIIQAGNSGFKGVEAAVNFCKSKNVPNISKIDNIEQMIASAIDGVENPLNVMGGSPGLQKVGQIIFRNISNTTELCSLLKHYYINGEDFLTAMKGEINTKLDSRSAADFILNVINKINNPTKVN